MKTLLCLTVVLGTLASPALTFAQTPAPTPLTRAQVVADLVRIEKAGYNPALGDDPNYPADIQAAEAKVAAQEAQPDQDAVGGASATGSSASGKRATTSNPAECTDPVSFCNIFYGS
ncbi:MAG: hypothetical protein QOI13_3404 [Paraburkholderia sp.]|nr:hypothetical protein [Paraburkholderia sp.]